MNISIILSLFVIICTFQVIEPLHIGAECELTENDIRDELQQLYYLISKSMRTTNCFKNKLSDTIFKVAEDNCGRALQYLNERFQEINNSTNNIEGLEICAHELINDLKEFFTLANIETEQCVHTSKIVENQVKEEIAKLEESKKSLKFFTDSGRALCYHEYPITWDTEVLLKCLNDVLVQGTAKAQDIMNNQEIIPEKFEKQADDVTDYSAMCCDKVQPKWFELIEPHIENYQKCVDKLIQQSTVTI